MLPPVSSQQVHQRAQILLTGHVIPFRAAASEPRPTLGAMPKSADLDAAIEIIIVDAYGDDE